eukprot:COSAG01_NODE_15166_length_1366_cov_2.281768_2_plen_244_part_00
MQNLPNNWARIIPQDGSAQYYWNTVTNMRQWDTPQFGSPQYYDPTMELAGTPAPAGRDWYSDPSGGGIFSDDGAGGATYSQWDASHSSAMMMMAVSSGGPQMQQPQPQQQQPPQRRRRQPQQASTRRTDKNRDFPQGEQGGGARGGVVEKLAVFVRNLSPKVRPSSPPHPPSHTFPFPRPSPSAPGPAHWRRNVLCVLFIRAGEQGGRTTALRPLRARGRRRAPTPHQAPVDRQRLRLRLFRG